jgi:hypothetical protein
MEIKENEVVFALVTFYKSLQETRFKLACRTITNAIAEGHAVAVVDGSPDPEITRHFTQLGARVFPQLHKGLGPAKQQSFFHAVQICNENNFAAVLADEAEKDLAEFVPVMLQPILNQKVQIVVPERTYEGWNSYPEFQRDSEREANREFAHVTGELYDIFFGPVMFIPSSVVAGYFLAPEWSRLGYPNTYTQHLSVLQAIFSKKIRIQSVRIEFRYPEIQKEEEETSLKEEMLEKRAAQLKTLTGGYINAGQFLRIIDKTTNGGMS